MANDYRRTYQWLLILSSLIVAQGCSEAFDRQSCKTATSQQGYEAILDDQMKNQIPPSIPKPQQSTGRLVVHPTNPAYFQDTKTGKAIFLHGYDHFRALQEVDNHGAPPFDFDALIAQLNHYNHNFLRLWVWEHFRRISDGDEVSPKGEESLVLPPHVYQRTGPGNAIDGLPKFNLEAFDQAYFDRLRQRVITAGENGIWVSVMLFQGWSIEGLGVQANTQWEGHPLNLQNNINDIDGDYDHDGRGWEVHTRVNPKINAIHDAYVTKVIETVGDLDNILYEISNETVATDVGGTCHHVTHVKDWMYDVINLIHHYERQRGFGPHPVGISNIRPTPEGSMADDWNPYLFESPAEYISPNGNRWNGDERWKKDPPAATGTKVVIADTDHIQPSLYGGPGMRSWQWRTFTRGHSMNAVDGDPEQGADWVTPDDSAAMQAIARYVDKVDLARMRPHNSLSSTRYCLADPGQTYIVYQPRMGLDGSSQGFPFELDVPAGIFQYEWFHPETHRIIEAGEQHIEQGITTFTPPFNDHAVLFLQRQHAE